MARTRIPRPSTSRSIASTRPRPVLATMKASNHRNPPSLRMVTPVDEGWTYNETWRIVTHSSACIDCFDMCEHYTNDIMDNNQTLIKARQDQDEALSRPWKTKIDDLERRHGETCQQLAELRQKISEARGMLAEARRDRERLVMAQPGDGLLGGPRSSASGPSSFLREPPRPSSYPRPTDPPQATEDEIIYISSDSDDDVSLIPPPNSRIPERD